MKKVTWSDVVTMGDDSKELISVRNKELLNRAKYIRDKFEELVSGGSEVYSSRYNVNEALKELGIHQKDNKIEDYYEELNELIRDMENSYKIN